MKSKDVLFAGVGFLVVVGLMVAEVMLSRPSKEPNLTKVNSHEGALFCTVNQAMTNLKKTSSNNELWAGPHEEFIGLKSWTILEVSSKVPGPIVRAGDLGTVLVRINSARPPAGKWEFTLVYEGDPSWKWKIKQAKRR